MISKLLISISVLLLMSCTSIPRKRPPTKAQPSAIEQLAQIKKRLSSPKTRTQANKQLDAFITTHAGTDIADDASLLGGHLAYESKDYGRAYTYFMNIADADVYSPLEGEALSLAADCLQRLGRFDEALALTERGLKYKNLPAKEKIYLYNLRFSILMQVGDRLDALDALVFMSQNEPNPSLANKYNVKVNHFIESTLTEDELKKVASKRSFGPFRATAYYRLGQQAFESREFDRAKSYFEDVISLSPESEMAEYSADFIRQIDARRTVSPKTIGAILPLSGRHASVAQKTLKGLQLGLGIYGKESSDFRLAIIDSEGNPDAARRAVERLVTEDHVIAIVGSLLSRTAIAVASKANELGVPNIALSQKSGITEVGDYVYRNALTSEMQIEKLVKVAMEDKGMRKFAILYPNDHYGTEYANIFWDHVLARGGHIVGAQPYDAKETDFSSVVSRLVGRYYLEDRMDEYQLRVKEWLQKQKTLSLRVSPPDDLLPPIVDFEAIFIPDSVRALGQIAPMLAYHDIQNVTLLGTNLWNSTSLLQRGQQLVEGAIFVDSLLDNDVSFQQSDFFKNYKSTFGETPGIFESQGYDAGIILRQLISSGQRSRAGLREALNELKEFRGSLGGIQTNSKRELSRPVVTLSVQDGKIIKQ